MFLFPGNKGGSFLPGRGIVGDHPDLPVMGYKYPIPVSPGPPVSRFRDQPGNRTLIRYVCPNGDRIRPLRVLPEGDPYIPFFHLKLHIE
jgi:hypothetical protein